MLDVQTGSQRYADSRTANAYPLPCSQGLTWSRADDTAVARVRLDHIAAQSIVIPSLSVVGAGDYAYEVALVHAGVRWLLPPVPNPDRQTPPPPSNNAAQVSTHIDCFYVHAPLSEVTVEFRLRAGADPERFLLTVSWRPLQLDGPHRPQNSVCCTPPPAISQMSQGGAAGPSICSPTCLAMILRGFGQRVELLDIAQQCYDAGSKLYGVWPNAIRTAALRGSIGATEAIASWAAAEHVLEQGYPLVASIRYDAGTLPGAPLQKTAGHLVVIHGTSPECVVTNDPAAPEVASVPRTYPADAFTQAWLRHRGAAYILVP